MTAQGLAWRTARRRQSIAQHKFATAKVRSFVVWTVVAIAVVAWTLVFRPTWLGGPAAYITVSGRSMLPSLHPGDLVVTQAAASYQVGEVVTYAVPAGHVASGARVIHRIVGMDETGNYVLRGDNTPGPDVWHPAPSDIVGRAWFVVPGVGNLVGLLRDPLLIASLAAAAFAAYLLSSPVRRDPPAEADQQLLSA